MDGVRKRKRGDEDAEMEAVVDEDDADEDNGKSCLPWNEIAGALMWWFVRRSYITEQRAAATRDTHNAFAHRAYLRVRNPLRGAPRRSRVG